MTKDASLRTSTLLSLGASVTLNLAFAILPAQAQCIPATIVEKISLSADDEQAIAACVASHSTNLGGTDAGLIKADRAKLLEPFSSKQVSASFRVRYAKALIPVITPLAEKSDEIVAVNALVIAGELATDSSLDLITRQLSRSESAIRYQATYAATRAIETMNGAQPAVTGAKASELLRSIEGRIAQETDPLILDGLIRTALASLNVSELRNQAVEVLARGVQKVIIAGAGSPDFLSNSTMECCLRAVTGVRTVMALPGITMSRDASLASGALAGDVMNAVTLAVSRKKLPLGKDGAATAREMYAQAAIAAETLALLAGRKLEPNTFNAAAKEAGKLIREGTNEGDAKFIVDAADLIGEKGVLCTKPFEFDKNRFGLK
ncbi:MAG: hypothetical protein ACK54H_03345 [Phycisphaerales bacterium]